jgi:acid phosphatase (class A)
MRIIAITAAAAGLLGAAPAPQAVQAPPATPATAPARFGYLAPDAVDTYAILPPAPVAGSPRYEADRQAFRETRKLEGSDRWKLAQNDDSSAGLLKDLSCAVGVNLTAENAPATIAMIRKVGIDSSRVTNLPKNRFKRQRPFLIDEGPICIPRPGSWDYPSGHNTYSWAVGLILAELAPDRATPILVRARAFGESRLVCGVHNLSAVEAGRTNGSILVAALHGEEAFRRDLEVARQEVAAARKAGPAPDPAACEAEAKLLDSPL